METHKLHGEWWREYVAGMTMREIAEVYGVSTGIISRALAKYKKELGEDGVEEARAKDLGRIEAMIDVQWRAAVRNGKIEPTKLVLAMIQLRAKILGYEAPQKVHHDGAVQHTIAPELVGMLERINAQNAMIQGELERSIEARPDEDQVVEAEVVDDTG